MDVQVADRPVGAGRGCSEVAVGDLAEIGRELGWRRWREIEEQSGLGMLKEMLRSASEAGRVPAGLVEPFAHILLAAGNELALVIALADDVAAAQASAEPAVDEFLKRLLQPADGEDA